MTGITDEGVARLRARIGVAQPHPQPPHYRYPNEDAFRHVAHAYGDDNPLWCDPAYAATSRWAGPIAPPNLAGGDTLIGENEVEALDEETQALLKGDPLGGAHAFYSGSFREWWEPLRPGMRVTRRNALVGVHDKGSEFAERAVHEWTAEVFATHDPHAVLCAQYRLMIRTERTKAEARGKYDETVIEPYTDEQLAVIDAQYATEPQRRRGAQPRFWEDVEEGDEVGPIVKGPLRVTDMVCWAWASTA
jgi:acyl dehydratase